MTEMVVHQDQTALTINPEQTAFTESQVAMLSHIGVENASEGDLAVFFHVVKRTGLDPFARQIYMIGRNSKNPRTEKWETKQTIQTGIDGYRLIGRRAADAAKVRASVQAPQWAHRDGGWRDVWSPEWGEPLAARVAVSRDGEEFVGVALFDEYKQTTRNGSLTSMWRQRPAGQIAKCAEALAWRMAFPQDLAGLYTDDEMGQADRQEIEAPVERSGSARMRAALQPKQPEEPAETPLVDGLAQQQDEAPDPVAITPSQVKKLGAMMREAGMTDRTDALAYVGSRIGREVQSRNELTKAEAHTVIDALDALLNPPTDWPEEGAEQ